MLTIVASCFPSLGPRKVDCSSEVVRIFSSATFLLLEAKRASSNSDLCIDRLAEGQRHMATAPASAGHVPGHVTEGQISRETGHYARMRPGLV